MLVCINGDRTFSQLFKRSYSVFGSELWVANFLTFYDRYEAVLFQGSVRFKVKFYIPVFTVAWNLLTKVHTYDSTFPCSLYLFYAYFGCWSVGIQSQTECLFRNSAALSTRTLLEKNVIFSTVAHKLLVKSNEPWAPFVRGNGKIILVIIIIIIVIILIIIQSSGQLRTTRIQNNRNTTNTKDRTNNK
jgi:hypothetical protein